MPPNQAPPSSFAYESSNVVDLGEIYVEIMEECRPFYSLATADKHLGCQKTLPPRLEDALKTPDTAENKKWNETVSSTVGLFVAHGPRVHGLIDESTPFTNVTSILLLPFR